MDTFSIRVYQEQQRRLACRGPSYCPCGCGQRYNPLTKEVDSSQRRDPEETGEEDDNEEEGDYYEDRFYGDDLDELLMDAEQNTQDTEYDPNVEQDRGYKEELDGPVGGTEPHPQHTTHDSREEDNASEAGGHATNLAIDALISIVVRGLAALLQAQDHSEVSDMIDGAESDGMGETSDSA